MITLSTIIATFGLIQNSAPAIIGAMIIAPLMGPILSAGFGIAQSNHRLIILSSITIAAGAATVVAISFVGVKLVGLRVAGAEILARTSPSLLDLGIALAAGCAGAFAQTRASIVNSVAGVAIAVALVPPLSVAGIGLGLGYKAVAEGGLSLSRVGLRGGGVDIAHGAFLLFLTNLLGIVLVAALVFVAQRYGRWKNALISTLVVTAASIIVVPPLYSSLYEIYVKNRISSLYFEKNDPRTKSSFDTFDSKIERISVSEREGILFVSIDIFVNSELKNQIQERLDDFQDDLTKDLEKPVTLELDVILVDTLKVRSKPQSK